MKISVFQLFVILFVTVAIAVASTIGVMLIVNRPSGDGMVVVYESTTPATTPAPTPTTPSTPAIEVETSTLPWHTDEWVDMAFDSEIIYGKVNVYKELETQEFLKAYVDMLDSFGYRFDVANSESPYCYSEAMLPLVIEFYQELSAYSIAAEHNIDDDYAEVVYNLRYYVWFDAAERTMFGEACGLYLDNWADVVRLYLK